MIVMKFGGSSLESAERYPARRISRSGTIASKTSGGGLRHGQALPTGCWTRSARRARQFVLGGTTDRSAAPHALHETREILGQRAEPFLRDSIAPLFRDLQVLLVELSDGRPFTPEIQDQALSFGERLSSLIVAEAFRHMGLPAAQVDARKVIVTNGELHARRALVLGYLCTLAPHRRAAGARSGGGDGRIHGSHSRGRHHHSRAGRIGLDGCAGWRGNFGGRDPDMDRRGWHAELRSADAIAGGYRIREISYQEAQEMARFGAKVLHPASVAPALRQRIPIVIRNSRRSEVEGTRVVSNVQTAPGIVKCLTSKAGMAVVHLRLRNRGMLSSITDGLADLFAREHIRSI